MTEESLKVESIDKKKKPSEHPAIVSFYEQMLRESQEKELDAQQLKVHNTAQTTFNQPTSSSEKPSLSGNVSRKKLGYNLFFDVYNLLYAPKEVEFLRKQLDITEKSKEIYRTLSYVIQLRLHLRQEKIKREKNDNKEVVIDSIDFTPPAEVKEHIFFTKKEKIDPSDLLVDKEISTVLQHLGYDLDSLKKTADQNSSSKEGFYVISFDSSISPKIQEAFSSRMKECAALEYLQDKGNTDLLVKENKDRYDFSKITKKEEVKKTIRLLKDLEQVVNTKCDQMPTDANNEFAKLQPLQAGQRLIDEMMAESLKNHNKLLSDINLHMGRGQ